MDTMIYNPPEEFESKYKSLHLDKTKEYFESLVSRSGVDIEANRATVKRYKEALEGVSKLRKKLNWWRFLRVLACITIILIPLVILKITPKIRKMREEIESSEKRAAELLAEAERQMAPLNNLFTAKDALRIIESTIPLISFADCFSAKQEADMRENYDFSPASDIEQSTFDVLAGSYNENPFLFENRLVHKMGTEVYHGYKTITWTETYRDSNGKLQRRTRSQTLHATVVKPKPFYSTRTLLNYCAQGGPELSFTRDATGLHEKSEKEIDRYVKKGEKKLKKMTDKALKEGDDFMSMSNTDFEVLFDALDRNDEVQYRTLFTPLAQTNMVDLITSKVGFGDDFDFVKAKRTNKISTRHSQGRALNLLPSAYVSYSFDIIRENFINKNESFFKAVYFDFAPVWAIPVYQDRPVHSLKPIPDFARMYSQKQYETLANALDTKQVAHPRTKTRVILKSSYLSSKNGVDQTSVKAYSYDIAHRVEIVMMLGGDGRMHAVPVPWDEYLPLENEKSFFVGGEEAAKNRTVLSRRNGICMFN